MTKMFVWISRSRIAMVSALLLAGLMVVTASAQAAPKAVCGVFQDKAGETTVRILSPNRLEMRYANEHRAPQFFLYQKIGNTLKAEDMDSTYAEAEEFTLSKDGRSLRYAGGIGETVLFRRGKPLDCAVEDAALNPVGQACRQDIGACKEAANESEASTEDLQAQCADHLPFACLALIERYEKSAKAALEKAENAATEAPAVCREGDPAFDEAACEDAVTKAIAGAFAKAFTSMYADPKPLPAQYLDRLPALCAENISGALCKKVAEKLWDGERYLEAAQSLARACAMPIGDVTLCAKAQSLAALDANALSQPAPTAATLPCGHYLSATGLMSEFNFVDRGRIEAGLGDAARARLENGLVRIRHDKGGDFVLRPLADGRLLGIDAYNRFALYERDGGQDQCAPPVIYREAELKMDCRVGEDIKACCERGGVQGCNGMGHAAVLAGDWDGALPFYQRVCAADIRSGCENLTKVGSEAAQAALEAICAKDAKAVACDVADLANWAGLMLERASREPIQLIEAEEALPSE
jgi:hypothetical protein